MNKKILAAVFSMALLCSCGNGNAEELSETGSESVSLASGSASETTVTTTAAETTSAAVSEETEIVTEVSEAEEKVTITRDFFNDDVVFEEVLLPVKFTSFNSDGTENTVELYEYDTAGNITKYLEHNYYADYMYNRTYEYDYNPNGTYNSVTYFLRGEVDCICRFDKNGYCVELISNVGSEYEYTSNYEYEFDDRGRLIRKEYGYGYYEYSYDENGRIIYETHSKAFGDIWYYKYEYGSNFENVYRIDLSKNEEILWHIMEKDENGNIIKETINKNAELNIYKGKILSEYKYDNLNRLIYENQTVSDDYFCENDDRINHIYSHTYEYEGDKLKKEIRTYTGGGYSKEYFYSDDGMILKSYNADGVLTNEMEYAMIPKIKTNIEYKNFVDVRP